MTKVTNIYIDTTGFTDEQYDKTNKALDELKGNGFEGWSLEEAAKPAHATFLFLDCDGCRQYFDDLEEAKHYFLLRDCRPASFDELLEMVAPDVPNDTQP